MKFENTVVYNIEGAVRGMRNPMNSWSKSDSNGNELGRDDLLLMQKLINSGREHRKFMRQILVCSDWTCPLYLWKEIDQYRVGVTTNSCSTMHKLASTPITKDCFEMGDYENVKLGVNSPYDTNTEHISLYWEILIEKLEFLRVSYMESKDKRYWKELIRLLPESWLQTRTITLNYEVIYSMIQQRKNHKLSEWSDSFIEWCHSLPYSQELLFFGTK